MRHKLPKRLPLIPALIAPQLELDLKWPTHREIFTLHHNALNSTSDAASSSAHTDVPPPRRNGHTLRDTSSDAVWLTATHMQLCL